MDRDLPRAPWLKRLASAGWVVLVCGGVGMLMALLWSSTTYRAAPLFELGGHALPVRPRAALAVLLALPLCWTKRWPERVFVVLLAESLTVAAFAERSWPLLLAMDGLIGYLAAVAPRRRTALFAAAAEFGLWCVEAPFVQHDLGQWSDYLSTAGAVAAGIAIPWTIGNSVRQQRRYGEALREHAAAQAVTAERLRIARELHDVVAHSIGVIAIQAGAASLVLEVDQAGVRKALAAIEATSRETLAGLRGMLVPLRQAEAGGVVEGQGPPAGLEAVGQLAEAMTQAGVEVDVSWSGEPRPLRPETDLAAYRIVQESVTNVVRHAGSARCEVHITYEEQELAIEVLDEGGGGVGRRGGGAGYGISGMRERVALLDGRFSAGARPEGGFRVAARLPV
ncbi:sensor histidine kinase [Kitasatospora purpeofusca]|uniref:sensor histidine kinase n=1 Tax=Kitasatospora purpeofusca TaxID=67352 RepID=UPI0036EDC553